MGREVLYKKFNRRGFKVGAEIGVMAGRNALDMFQHIPGLKLYLIDPWYKNGRYNVVRAYRMTRKRVLPYNAVIIRKESIEAAFDIPDRSLDFVYIDGPHHYNAVMLDTIIWSPKVRAGGIVSGHDYNIRQPGVKNAVDDYVRYHKIDLQRCQRKNWFWET